MTTGRFVLPFQIDLVPFSSYKSGPVEHRAGAESDHPDGLKDRRRASSGMRAADGDVAALDSAFRNDGGTLLHYLGRHAGPDDAPDLLQEVFLRAAGSDQRRRLVNPAAFLQRIARNLLINRAISTKRNKIVLLPFREEHDIATPPEQELEMEAADLLRLYERAIEDLSEKTRRVFLMHRVDELSYREIHQRLGISIATVEYHMMKALAHIAEVVDPIDER